MSLREPSNDPSNQPSPETSTPKQPASERRIQANRRNALRSTGPKTARGKRTVARNAIRHGLLAREVVISAGDGAENLEEFNNLVEKLCESYEPVGIAEELLVQKIASCWWRKARVIRAENGEIRKRLDSTKVEHFLKDSDEIALNLASAQLLNSWDFDDADTEGDLRLSKMKRLANQLKCQSNVRNSREGLEYLSEAVTQAKSDIASEGHIKGSTLKMIFDLFGLWDYMFAYTAYAEGNAGEHQDCRENEKLTRALDREMEKINLLKQHVTIRQNLEVDAQARSFSLPPADVIDKVMRYEAHLDRQLYRAMDQLERLQRQRRGETVPPPLNINVGRRN